MLFGCYLAFFPHGHISLAFISVILPSLPRNSCFMCHTFWAMYKSSYVEQILNCCLFFFLLLLCQVHANPKSAAIIICIFNNCTTNTDTSGTTFTTTLLHLMFAVKIGSLWLWLFVPSSFYIFPFYFLLVYALFSIGIANNMILLFFLEVVPNDTIFPTIMVSHVISFTPNFWLKL